MSHSAQYSHPFPGRAGRFDWLASIVVLVLVVGAASPFWNVPLSRDQGVYATCADSLLRGGLPFRDCWDTKGPALHYTYALARLIFGLNPAGPYILNAFAIAATAVVVARLFVSWLGGRWLAYAVGLLYGLLAVAVRFDMNAQPESFANWFAMLGLLALTRGVQLNRRWLFPAGGAALAVAVLYKYALLLPFGTAALSVLLALPLDQEERRLQYRLRLFALTAAGSLGIVALFALYLLISGVLDDALLHLRFIFFYFPKAQLNPDEYAIRSHPVRQTLAYFGRLPAIVGLAFIGCGTAIRQRRWYGFALGFYILAGIAVVWGQQRFTPYHWTAMLPALVLSIGALLVEIDHWASLSRPIRRGLAAVLGIAIALNAGLYFYTDQWLVLGGYLTGAVEPEVFLEEAGAWDQMVVADYIRERTEPDDPIWVWGHHTPIYYLADRRSPTRFIYNEPLLMRIRGGHPWRDEWRAEALDAIYRDPPVYIVLTLFDRTFFDFQNPIDSWYDIPAYGSFTDRYYLMEFPFGRFQVWRLKPYWSRNNTAELLDAVTVVDLIERFDRVEVKQQSDPPIGVTTFEVLPEPAYDTLLMQPDASLSYRLDLPPSPVCLRFDTVMFPDSWTWGGDGATFIVEVEAGGQQARLFESYLSNDASNHHWHAHLVDLSQYGGQSVKLTLRTTPGPGTDYTGDWAGWGLPRVVRPPSGDRCDTNAIVDTR
jgi:4-amino-4-deoxy-L-arabinose transferase-like glycosyltransferase